MKFFVSIIFLIFLSGCSVKPYEETKIVYSPSLTEKREGTTKVYIHRAAQLSGSALGDDCPLEITVDGLKVAGLLQNQYVNIFLEKGKHTITVRFKCAITSWRKSLEVEAYGKDISLETELGAAGQYRMWQID